MGKRRRIGRGGGGRGGTAGVAATPLVPGQVGSPLRHRPSSQLGHMTL